MNLADSIVAILNPKGKPVGTGFVIGDDLIVSCAHVINQAIGKLDQGNQAGGRPNQPLQVQCYKTGETVTCQVEGNGWRAADAEDVALLRASSRLPVLPLDLGNYHHPGETAFQSFGFPEPGALSGGGIIIGWANHRGQKLLQLRSSEVTSGFSGAPVLDRAQGYVVGMIRSITEPDLYNRLNETTFAISTQTILQICTEAGIPLQIQCQSPYMGLRFFDTPDADRFFGREQLILELLTRLAKERFLAIIGASGSGKSSVVRAGLIPAVMKCESLPDGMRPPSAGPGWKIHIFTPGAQPIKALAEVLTAGAQSNMAQSDLMAELLQDPTGLDRFTARATAQSGVYRLLIVVDQFEEIFKCQNEQEKKAFVDNLLMACAPQSSRSTSVVITLRADFYDGCGSFANLRAALGEHQKYIGPMNPDEMRRAIEEPARIGGWEFEPGLVDLILGDAVNEPGSLPLLSHALQATWQARRGWLLTLEAYHSVGGVRKAIATTAETVFREQLTLEEKEIARELFLRLTEMTESAQTTRRRVPLKEFTDLPKAKQIEPVLKMLTEFNTRLVVAGRNAEGEEYIEVAHEALIREWPRLHDWVEQGWEANRLGRKLEELAQEWARMAYDPSLLFVGKRLAAAEDWANAHPENVTQLIKDFLHASRAQRARDQRTRRLLQAGLISSVLIVIAVLAFASISYNRQARIAASRELAAAADSNLLLDPERSILLALRSAGISQAFDQSIQAYSADALRRAVHASRVRLTLKHAGEINDVAFSPDGTRLVSGCSDNTVIMWDAIRGTELYIRNRHTGAVNAVSFSADGSLFATASSDKTVKVWDTLTGQELLTLSGHNESVMGLSFHPNGTFLATASTDGTARIWDLTKRSYESIQGQGVRVFDVAYNPDGSKLAVGYGDGRTVVWDMSSLESLTLFDGVHSNPVSNLAFSPNGKWLATSSSSDGISILWDLETGQPAIAPFIMTDTAFGAAFSPDGTRVAFATGERTAQVWALDAVFGTNYAHLQYRLAGHTKAVSAVAFSPDGQMLATACYDGMVKVWDVSGHAGQVNSIVFNQDGTLLLTASSDHTIKVWDAITRKSSFSLPQADVVWQAVFSPNGSQIAAALNNGTAVIWDATSGKTLFTLSGHYKSINDLAYSPDGDYLVTGSWDNTAKVWDTASGAELLTLAGHTDSIHSVAYRSDGMRIATGGWDKTVKIWDAHSGMVFISIPEQAAEIQDLAFSPDGKFIAAALGDNTARVWDAASGQEKLKLTGHTQPIKSVTYNADGSWLITAGADGKVKLWDTTGGKELLSLDVGLELNDAAIRPDNAWLSFAAVDGNLHLYPLDFDALVVFANSHLTRSSLSSVECQQYLPGALCP
jgi:WD40 repeat protein